MKWSDRISIDSEVLQGKPVVKGSRLAVEFIVDLLAQGWTSKDILRNYPALSSADIQACLSYATSLMRGEELPPVASAAATGSEPHPQVPKPSTPSTGDIQGMPPIPQLGIRGILLVPLIASLSLSALVAIFVFLLGDFGETEIRLLLTTLTIGAYSLTGMCASVLYERKRYILLARAGIVVSATAFLITLGAIWEIIDFENVWKPVAIFTVLAFSIAHSSLLLLAPSDKILVNRFLAATITFIVLVALMLSYLVLDEYDVGDFYYRWLGVFAVLDVLGTIVTPILRKVSS